MGKYTKKIDQCINALTGKISPETSLALHQYSKASKNRLKALDLYNEAGEELIHYANSVFRKYLPLAYWHLSFHPCGYFLDHSKKPEKITPYLNCDVSKINKNTKSKISFSVEFEPTRKEDVINQAKRLKAAIDVYTEVENERT